MQRDLIEVLQNPTLLFLIAMALTVSLFIVLVVVISSMRVRKYKVGYINAKVASRVAKKQMAVIQEEYSTFKSSMQERTEELKQFSVTKNRLQEVEKMLLTSEKIKEHSEQSLKQSQKEFNSLKNYYERLLETYNQLEKEVTTLRKERDRFLVQLKLQAKK